MNNLETIRAVRIFIYSQDPHLVALLNNILSGAGYQTRSVEDLRSTPARFEAHEFDLGLIDLRRTTKEIDYLLSTFQEETASYTFPWIALVGKNHTTADIPPGARGVITLPIGARKLLNQVAATIERLEDRPIVQAPHNELTSDDDMYEMFARNVLEQKTLSDIAQTLNSTLDLNTVLTKVVDAATTLTPAEEGLLLLPDDTGNTLYIRAEKGIDHETARQFRIRTRDTLAGQVFKTGRPVLIDDPNWRELKSSYYVRSLLYVPLRVKDQVIGVLGVNNRTSEQTFSKHDLMLLEDLASHAAIAIENARLYGESIARSHELQVLVNASQAVNSTLALDGVLDMIADQLTSTLGVAWCEISRWIPKTKQLNVLATHREVHWDTWDTPTLPLTEAEHFLQALDDQKALRIEEDYFSIGTHYGAWLVPLHVNRQPLGILELIYHQHDAPEELFDLDQFKQMGLAIAIGIDPRQREDREHSLDIVRDLLQQSHATSCRLWTLSLGAQRFEQQVDVGYHTWTTAPYPTIDTIHLPQMKGVIEAREPRHIFLKDEINEDDAALLRHYNARSVLLLPMYISRETLGLVALIDTLQSTAYSEREIRLIEALVVQAANAIQNARLYFDLETSLEELRMTQGKLVQTARMSAIGELAAAVAHQINNPLTTILVDTELLLQDTPSENSAHESLAAIHRAGKRALEVVRRLLSMSYKNKEDEQAELSDINATIRNTVQLVSGHIEQYNIKLLMDLGDELPHAAGLPGQLEDVWLNLLMNSRDAVRDDEAPIIGIKSYAQDNYVIVDVWDNGPGIPEPLREQIFEAFFTTKSMGQGTGLGLHICKQVVEKCGGRIKIHAAETKGALFRIELPTQLVTEKT